MRVESDKSIELVCINSYNIMKCAWITIRPMYTQQSRSIMREMETETERCRSGGGVGKKQSVCLEKGTREKKIRKVHRAIGDI